jgi:hypothetical protein
MYNATFMASKLCSMSTALSSISHECEYRRAQMVVKWVQSVHTTATEAVDKSVRRFDPHYLPPLKLSSYVFIISILFTCGVGKKLMVSLCRIKNDAMKACGGSEGIAPPFLMSALDGALHITAWGNSPWYPLDRRLDGPRCRCGRYGEEKNVAPAGNQTVAVWPVARCYTDWTTHLRKYGVKR